MQGVGVGITTLRRGAVLASVALRRRLLVTLEINNKDRAYDWFLAWLAHQQRTTRRPAWAHSHQLSVETAYAQHKNGSADVLFKLVAGPGVHWLQYRGAWMQVSLFAPTAHPFLSPTHSHFFLSLMFVSFFFR
jgi:mitochondrial chaperone BCS1